MEGQPARTGVVIRQVYYPICRSLFVYGPDKKNFSYRHDRLVLEIDLTGPRPHYYRESNGSRAEKLLVPNPGMSVVISPAGPVRHPKEIAQHLEIRFPALVLAPGTSKQIFLKFPIEIAVFIQSGSDTSLLDSFSCTNSKFSLYGTPVKGIITRYCESGIFDEVPNTDPVSEAVMALTINNAAQTSVEVSRAIFRCQSMKLFYGETVGTTAAMQIISAALATTNFESTAPEGCPERAVDLSTGGTLTLITEQRFYMEWGLK